MNDNQNEHLSMYLTVNQFLLDHAPDLVSVSQIAGLQTLLQNRIEKITDYAALSGSDTTGFTIQKGQERLDLEEITLKVSRACAAYYLSINNPGGFKLADYTPSEIESKRDNDLFSDSKWLYKIAQPIEANLSSFNSGPADVLALKNLYTAFFDVIRLPKMKRDEKATGTKMLDAEFEKAGEIMTQLDVYMLTFQPVDAMLYLEYEKARAIDSTGGGSQNTKSGTLQGNGIANAAFAEGKLTADTGLLLYNNSTGPDAGDLQFYFCATATGAAPDPDKIITLAAGDDLATTALAMDYSVGKPFLNIFNPTAAEGKWKIVLAE